MVIDVLQVWYLHSKTEEAMWYVASTITVSEKLKKCPRINWHDLQASTMPCAALDERDFEEISILNRYISTLTELK